MTLFQKVLHDAIEDPLLAECFHKEPLTHKMYFVVFLDYKLGNKEPFGEPKLVFLCHLFLRVYPCHFSCHFSCVRRSRDFTPDIITYL